MGLKWVQIVASSGGQCALQSPIQGSPYHHAADIAILQCGTVVGPCWHVSQVKWLFWMEGLGKQQTFRMLISSISLPGHFAIKGEWVRREENWEGGTSPAPATLPKQAVTSKAWRRKCESAVIHKPGPLCHRHSLLSCSFITSWARPCWEPRRTFWGHFFLSQNMPTHPDWKK